jgi:threonine dehydrogenase-like Zn-dependent dehydrogenase
MKAAVTNGMGKVWIEDVPIPEINDYQCLCKINACASCTGTDLMLISNQPSCPQNYPAILGHESVGTVTEIGGQVRNIKIGDRFLRPTCVYPGHKLGDYSSLWGGFAEYGVITDAAALFEDQPDAELNNYIKFQQKIPADLNISDANTTMLITLKETASYIISAGITLNKSVLVLGAGSVGICMIRFAKTFGGCPVIAVARRDEQLGHAKKIGADFTINVNKTSLCEEVNKITGEKGVDFIIDTTGNKLILAESLTILAQGGKIAPYAVNEKGENVRELVKQDRISTATTGEDVIHQYMLGATRLSLFNPADFYSHTLPLDKIEEGFEMLKCKKALKIVFKM